MENEITLEFAGLIALAIALIIVLVLYLCFEDVKEKVEEIEKSEVSELSCSARYRQTAEKMEELKR